MKSLRALDKRLIRLVYQRKTIRNVIEDYQAAHGRKVSYAVVLICFTSLEEMGMVNTIVNQVFRKGEEPVQLIVATAKGRHAADIER